MGLRPPIVRSRAGSTKSAPKATTKSAPHERAVRPVAERTGPLRTTDQLMRTEDGISPIGDAVSKAYQVFDRYLKEGREYAAGQSAWYNGEGALPSFAGAASALPSIPGLPAMPNLPAMPQQDVLAAAMWLLDQLRATTPGAATMAPLASAVSSVAKPGNWPMPQWPTAQAGSSKWTEERFDGEADPKATKSKAIGAYNIDDQASRKSKFGFKS